ALFPNQPRAHPQLRGSPLHLRRRDLALDGETPPYQVEAEAGYARQIAELPFDQAHLVGAVQPLDLEHLASRCVCQVLCPVADAVDRARQVATRELAFGILNHDAASEDIDAHVLHTLELPKGLFHRVRAARAVHPGYCQRAPGRFIGVTRVYELSHAAPATYQY